MVNHDWFYTTLNIRIDDHWYFDALRLLVVVASGSLFAYSMMRLRERKDRISRLRALTWINWCLLASLNEMEQLGQRVLVWRLPLFMIGTSIGLIQMVHMEVRNGDGESHAQGSPHQ